jgi:single-strand DNA-binding protein
VPEVSTTIIGRLTADPEIKFTSNGNALVNFSIAVNRKKGEEEYTSFFDCTAWGTLAQNTAESLHKGDRVILSGDFVQDRFEGKDGKKQSKVTFQVNAVGAELRFATATVRPVSSESKPKVEAGF